VRNSDLGGFACGRVLLLAVFTFISVCNAQRADDPNSAAKINDQLRRETLPTVEKKAAAGDADSQLELALGYSVGGYLPKDDKLAAEWCSRAARQGMVAAQTTMGYFYSTGKGVPHSDKEAMRWWRKAADQGSADAQFNLGEFYGLGRGSKRDYKEAVKWFRKAAEQGEPDAQYHLGLMYEGGTGVAPDTTEALRWYRLSAAQGFVDAREKVDGYAKLFPPQHEFSLGDQSPLSVDQALEQMAQEYSGQTTDRVVRDDIAFPANETEYKNLGKHAILLLAAVTHDPAELPITRVYLEKEAGVLELQKVGSFLCRTPRGSAVERVLGPYRENAFYLLPISSYFQQAKLVIDFARNRSGFQLIQFPEEVKTDFVLADSDHGQGRTLQASTEAVHAIVLREYGIDLAVWDKQTK
jgi:TPR repeat protein